MPRGLHSNKLEYDHMSAGWPAQLTASAFTDYVSIPAVLVTGPTVSQNSPFLS